MKVAEHIADGLGAWLVRLPEKLLGAVSSCLLLAEEAGFVLDGYHLDQDQFDEPSAGLLLRYGDVRLSLTAFGPTGEAPPELYATVVTTRGIESGPSVISVLALPALFASVRARATASTPVPDITH